MSSTLVSETSILIVSRSDELASIQARWDAPFGMLFLHVPRAISPTAPIFAQTTSSSEETSNDGSSKLDPVSDEDEEDDE